MFFVEILMFFFADLRKIRENLKMDGEVIIVGIVDVIF